MKKEQGFTVIELFVAFIVLVVLTVFFAIQRDDLEVAARDQERKTAINAMYYSLTEDFYRKNNYYPKEISRDTLKSVDPTLFTDPMGYTLEGNKCNYTGSDNEQASDGDCEYHYTASDCDGDKCKKFKLTAKMEAEGNYTKESPKSSDK